ncbi:MAG TPA: membrane protein insertase YidC, partial [Usitatibacter sp.]
MMDTQRLIALIVFSVSALFLWEAWQKQNAPKAVTTTSTVPAVPTSAAPVPVAGAPSAPGATAAAPTLPNAAPAATTGEPIAVRTDLFDVELNSLGGDIHRVTMRKVYSALDRSLPLTLMEPDAKHYFVTQSGLLGDGLPTHKTEYESPQRSYSLADGKDSVEVSLKARDANGAEVTKRYTFHRGSYVIDVAYDVANRSEKPIAPFAYFQFLRDANPPSEQAAQTSAFAGVTTFTGPAVYTDEAKFHKVDFKDIAKGSQS